MEEHDTIKLKKSTMWKIGTAVFAILFIVSLVTGGFKGSSDSGTVPTAPTGDSGQPTNIDVKELLDDDPMKGDANAPVTIIEWSDFECPFCSRFYEQTLPLIQEQYIDTGKVKLVYRDFPLTSLHPTAQKAAEAAECADEQGKFWEYHDKIFENQALLSVTSLKQWAADLGLDTEKFNDCLDSGKMASEVNKDLQDGADVGIRGTPGFIINGQLISGAQPFSVFQQVIESQL